MQRSKREEKELNGCVWMVGKFLNFRGKGWRRFSERDVYSIPMVLFILKSIICINKEYHYCFLNIKNESFA